MAGPDDSAYQDNPYGTSDPYNVYAQAMNNPANGPAGTTAGAMARNATAAGFNPQVQQSQAVQAQMKKILQGVGPQGEDEDPYDYQTRLGRAVVGGMMNVDPSVAMRANQQVLRLNQAKTQQENLQAEVAERTARAGQEEMKTQQMKAQRVAFGVYETNKNGIQTLRPDGELLDPYADDFNEKLQARMLQYQQAGITALPFYGTDKLADESSRLQANQSYARIIAAQMHNPFGIGPTGAGQPGADITDPTKPHIADYALNNFIFGNGRTDMNQRAAAMIRAQALGIEPADIDQAQAEWKGMQAQVNTAAKRQGNTAILIASLGTGVNDDGSDQLGKVVLDTMSKVDRTRIPLINSYIKAGMQFFGSPAEQAYYDAVQSYQNEYARLMSGGGSQSSVFSQVESRNLLSAKLAPDAMRAALGILGDKETRALQGAGNMALEALANPQNYPAVTRILSKMPAHFKVEGDTATPNAGPNAPQPQLVGPNGGDPNAKVINEDVLEAQIRDQNLTPEQAADYKQRLIKQGYKIHHL